MVGAKSKFHKWLTNKRKNGEKEVKNKGASLFYASYTKLFFLFYCREITMHRMAYDRLDVSLFETGDLRPLDSLSIGRRVPPNTSYKVARKVQIEFEKTTPQDIAAHFRRLEVLYGFGNHVIKIY